MKFRARWPRAKARCWWSTPRRAWKPKLWPTPISPSINGLEIIPVINKIDLPSADIPRTKEMIESAVGLDASDAVLISAKTGQGIPDVLEAIVKRVPPPKGNPDNRLQALIFDSWFDAYRGVVVLTRVFQGTLRKGQRIRLRWNGTTFDAETLGVLMPQAGRDRRTESRRSRIPHREYQERR